MLLSFLSFIGVSKSLPMTAYIKMIDIWMIFTMFYPFCMVTLYSVMELIRNDEDAPLTRKRMITIIFLMIDYGLPTLAITFSIIFWVLGIINTTAVSTALDKTC